MTYTLDPPLPRTATPTDYTRFKFDTAEVPDKRIVGLLACQRDPLLQSLRTRLHAANKAVIKAPPPQKGKGGQKKAQVANGTTNGSTAGNAETTKGDLFEVELLDTVIFPEGGGQPADTGVLRLFDPNGGVETELRIEGCLRRKLDSVHLVRVPPGTEVNWAEGREVEVVVDWQRRIDQMTIHTSQHLLSAVLDTYNLPTLSWSMHAFPSLECPYVELSRALTLQEAEEVEQKCNDLIAEGKKVWVDVSIQRKAVSEAEGGEEGGSPEERENRGIPKDYDGGVIRHIIIQDTDRNACCGTQLPDISLISTIHVIPPTTASATATKLYFTSGTRANRYLIEASRQLSGVAKVLGRARGEVVKAAEISEGIKKDAVDSLRSLRGEMSKIVGDRAVGEASVPANRGIVWVKREERSTHDFDFLGLVGSVFTQAQIAVPVAMEAEAEEEEPLKPLIVLTSSAASQGGGAQTLLMILSTDHELSKDVNDKIKAALEGRVKGGGAKGRYMSKIDGKWGKKEIGLIQAVLDEGRAGRA
ncbi:hypothetical protein IAU60_000140 [Kwoniella sp. DSM 27419]